VTDQSQKFPGLIQIRAHEGAFILTTDKSSVHYQSFDNLTRDILPSIRAEFKLADSEAILGSC
jgi:hypothetical protein